MEDPLVARHLATIDGRTRMRTQLWAMDIVKVSFTLHTEATSFRLPNFMLLGKVEGCPDALELKQILASWVGLCVTSLWRMAASKVAPKGAVSVVDSEDSEVDHGDVVMAVAGTPLTFAKPLILSLGEWLSNGSTPAKVRPLSWNVGDSQPLLLNSRHGFPVTKIRQVVRETRARLASLDKSCLVWLKLVENDVNTSSLPAATDGPCDKGIHNGYPWYVTILLHPPRRKASQWPSSYAMSWLTISPEVEDALREHRPVVALESTIISHGMPYPQNLKTALEVEAVLRDRGVVPATIGILKGQVHVGMNGEQLEALAQRGLACKKVSRRDIAQVLAKKQDGATTVSATMIFAHQAKIPIFVTGGIGGVHRGDAWDVSADLTELGRTPVCVVCAGAKSILDLPRTLEFLETQGVCVCGYGTDDFPAFFTPKSGLPTSCRVDGPAEAAQLLQQQLQIQLNSGMVLGVPVPDHLAAEGQLVEDATRQAVDESMQQGIKGNEVTPFLLKRINELTGGESLRANIALIKHNAEVGAQLAIHLAKLGSQIHLSIAQRRRQPGTAMASRMDSGLEASMQSLPTKEETHDDGESVRVYLRVRPATERELAIASPQVVFVDGPSVTVKSDPPRSFTFDGVLGETSTQQEVFESVGRAVGSSCLAGYNGSVYVYGQTGAGKTHTMCGPINSVQSMQFDERRGIICRMLDFIFAEEPSRVGGWDCCQWPDVEPMEAPVNIAAARQNHPERVVPQM
eukprot:s3508_g11.t1